MRIKSIGGLGSLVVLLAAVLAGCGSSSNASTATQKQTASSTPAVVTPQSGTTVAKASGTTVVIASYKTPEDGTLVTGAQNRTLYVFKPDEKSTAGHDKVSTCYDGCASVWPPVLATQTPTVSGQANAALVGLATRKDGTKQATYNGLPLYYYAADTKAGQATGNHLKDGFGVWTGILPSGKLAPDGAN